MSPVRLLLREIAHRKVSFCLGALSAAVAVGCLVGSWSILQRHDARTEQVISRLEASTRERVAKLEDDYRKITKGLGFNVLILPKEQDLGDLFTKDYAERFMPEEYVDRLARSKVVTIQHLLPSLQQKLKWPEQERTVILMGVRGEVPLAQASAKQPLLETVVTGTMVLGSELHCSLKLKVGDRTRFMGREFTLAKAYPERGTKDDITVWINLREAQELLGHKGQINGILALECVCAADSLQKVRAEIVGVLPETQVIEFQSQALARAEARQRAAAEAEAALQHERDSRARLRKEREDFASVLVPGVMAVAAVWIGLLAWNNVRDRRQEIGILRSIGVRTGTILGLLLSRAALMGLTGALLGFACGWGVGAAWQDAPGAPAVVLPLHWGWLWSVLAGAPLVAILAAWLPSLLAAQMDPAETLVQE
jgi:putative ABC transport system permease protein